jgi:hypothetical protein
MTEETTPTGYRGEEEIAHLAARFEASAIPRKEWTHAAHLTIALWYLTRCDVEEATKRIRTGIQRLNAANGVLTTPTGGYHETLTLFWIHRVRLYLSRSDQKISLTELANGLIRTCSDSKLPLFYYSRECLFSPKARFGWVEPDGNPLELIP